MYIGFADGDDDPSVQSRVCVDGHAFWLVGVGASKTTKVCEKKRSPAVIMGDTQPECTRTQPYFKKLYGWSGLDGAQWGGLTKEDIAVNAINSWHAAGMTNGWTNLPIDAAKTDVVHALVDKNFKQAVGVVNIPVCNIEDAFAVIKADPENSSGNKNYPSPT